MKTDSPQSLMGWFDTFVGTTLLSSVFWMRAIEQTSTVLHFVILCCGAVIGVNGVRRVFRGREVKESDDVEE